jgi:succinoglycan biosynthesis protein ExoL
MFRRVRPKASSPPTWDNVDLGATVDRNYLKRLPRLLAAAVKLLRYRPALKRCQIFYARNIDMLVLAFLAKRLAGSRAALAYEVLDVQRIFVGDGIINKSMRWAERWLLARCDVLVVSSPDFMSQYFQPRQRFSGAWYLLENKIFALSDGQFAPGPKKHEGPPWVIGWFGTLRCVRSLEILAHIADALGDRVSIHIRGLPSHEDLTVQAIEAACGQRANMLYGGPYASPRDLPAIYAKVHFAWCVDYLDAGLNSDWLLPNRLYEGGLMGALAIARNGTATAHMVERRDLGWSFAEPLESTVADFVAHLDAAEYEDKHRALESMSRAQFVDLTDTRDLLQSWMNFQPCAGRFEVGLRGASPSLAPCEHRACGVIPDSAD